MSIAILYIEELKATMRGRFAWLGAGVVLFALGGLATVATQDTWLDGYGIVAYFLVPLTFIPLAAGIMRYPIDVTATYRVAGESAPRVLKARAAIEAQIASAGYEMGVASMILPALCFGAC